MEPPSVAGINRASDCCRNFIPGVKGEVPARVAATGLILLDQSCSLAGPLHHSLAGAYFEYRDSQLGNGGLFELAWPALTADQRILQGHWRMSFPSKEDFQYSDQLALGRCHAALLHVLLDLAQDIVT